MAFGKTSLEREKKSTASAASSSTVFTTFGLRFLKSVRRGLGCDGASAGASVMGSATGEDIVNAVTSL